MSGVRAGGKSLAHPLGSCFCLDHGPGPLVSNQCPITFLHLLETREEGSGESLSCSTSS